MVRVTVKKPGSQQQPLPPKPVCSSELSFMVGTRWENPLLFASFIFFCIDVPHLKSGWYWNFSYVIQKWTWFFFPYLSKEINKNRHYLRVNDLKYQSKNILLYSMGSEKKTEKIDFLSILAFPDTALQIKMQSLLRAIILNKSKVFLILD